MNYIWLKNVEVFKSSKKRSTSKKKKQKKPHFVERICKVEFLKLWCNDPVDDETCVMVEDSVSPYCIELEKKAKVKKPRVKHHVDKKRSSSDSSSHKGSTFDPLLHVKQLSSGKTSSDSVKRGTLPSFMKPMPYNEKLRRGGAENSLLIAESQLARLEIIKGKYRKAATEYPALVIEDTIRRNIDLRIVDGQKIDERRYWVVARSQDKHLGDLASRAGGTLSLTGHNITVIPSISCGKVGKDGNVIRESYSTRRKKKIELTSFDSSLSFSTITKQAKPIVVETSSSSEQEEEEEEDAAANLTLFNPNPSSKSVKLMSIESDISSASSSSLDILTWEVNKKKMLGPKSKQRQRREESLLLEEIKEMSLNVEEMDQVEEFVEKMKIEIVSSRSSSLEKRIVKNKVDEDFSLFNQI